jgi:catechol 2,3-dioxygenase-like lactoylglutathione lyase family enzyme
MTARLAHIGIAVPRIADALPFYRDILGLVPRPAERADGAEIVSLPFGDVDVELLEPVDPDGPSPGSWPSADRAFITSATAYRIWTPRSRAAGLPGIVSSTRRPAPAPAAGASPFCIPRRPAASCSS